MLFQDLELVLKHLEEVRFFDLFGYSEETGSWLCFMCNNPEKATGNKYSPLLLNQKEGKGMQLTKKYRKL